VVQLKRADAEVWNVGKRGGDLRSVPQAEISELLASLAEAHKSVVRLKACDPCLFGRATEEIRALRERNLPYIIVPGVTSVSAAAAACRMSLTERDVGRSVVTVSGHDPDKLCYDALGRMDTIAILMAGKHLSTIVERLHREGGVELTRRVDVVQWALRSEQVIARGTVEDIAQVTERVMPGGVSPAVVLIHKHLNS
jgi:siroheme synthase